MVIKSIKNELT